MSNEAAQQIKNMVSLLKNKKKLAEITDGLSLSEAGNLLNPGTYAYKDANGKLIVKEFDSAAELLKLASDVKKLGNPVPVKLTNEEASAIANVIKLDSSMKIAVTLEKVAEFKDKDKIGRVPIELKAALSAVASFKASLSGISAKLGLSKEVSVTFGEEGSFQYTAKLAASAEAAVEIGLTGLKAKAEAKAEASHELKCKEITIGKYGIIFFANLKAFAVAVAEAEVGIGGIKKGAFAGIGVSGELGLELHGVYSKGGNPNKRMLGAASVELEAKAGVGGTIEAKFSSEEEDVDGEAFTTYSFDLDVALFVGAGLALKISVLSEIKDDALETIKNAIRDKVIAILGDEVINYIKEKYEAAKSAVVGTVSKAANYVIGSLGDAIGKGKSYTTIHNNLGYHIKSIEERLAALQKTSVGSEQDKEEIKNLKAVAIKLKEYTDKHSTLVTDYDTELNELVKAFQKAQKTGTEEAILKAVEDNFGRIEEIETICNQMAQAKIDLNGAIFIIHSSDQGFEAAYKRIQGEIQKGIEEAGYAEAILKTMHVALKDLVYQTIGKQ